MKTRNIIAILAALPIMAGMTSCKSDEETSAKPAKEMLRVLGGNVEIRSNDETTVVNVSADCHWKVDNVDAGDFGANLTIQPREGLGDGTLVVSTDQNTTKADRTATFTLVSDGGLKQHVTIRQTGSGDGLNLSKGTLSFDAEPQGAQSLVITSNTSWSIQVPAGNDWVHLTKTSGGSGADVIDITVDNAVTDVVRSVTIPVIYGSSSAEFVVTQQGMAEIYLMAPENIEAFSYSGGEQMVFVESNAEWHAFVPSSVSWAYVEPATGVGNGEFRIMCNENTSSRTRLTAIVLVAGTKNPQQRILLVEQEAQGQQPSGTVTLSDLYSLYVADNMAEFRFSFVADDNVGEYGLVYSTSETQPTRDNSDFVVTDTGGTTKNVLAQLSNLQPNTTYYVRAFVQGNGQNVYYSPNVVTIKTSSSTTEPGESDNPDPTL